MSRRPWILIGAIAMLGCESATQPRMRRAQPAQPATAGTSRNVSQVLRNAERRALDGEYQLAFDITRRALPRNGSISDAAAERLHAAAGYYAHAAAEGAVNSHRLTEAARRHYQQALRLNPSNLIVADNLALLLEELGETEAAVGVITSALRQDGEDHAARRVMLGDLLVNSGDVLAGVNSYKKALRESPSDQIALRLVQTYDQGPDDWLSDFHETCLEIYEAGSPRRAGQGWQAIALRALAPEQGDEELAETALLHWAEVEAERGTFALDRLKIFEQSGTPKPGVLRSLEALAEAPLDAEVLGIDAWRLHLSALLLKSIADTKLTEARGQEKRGDEGIASATQLVGDAVSIYERANKMSPDYSWYAQGRRLHGKPIVRLDTALRLASVLHRRQTMVPNANARFRTLEDRLFDQKTSHYPEQNYAAIQAYHVVFGQIYWQREQWKYDEMPGAEYHLEQAVWASEMRSKEDPGFFDPLPRVHELLAFGFETEAAELDGKERDVRLNKAAEHYDRAVRAHLQLNDVAGAEQVVQWWNVAPSRTRPGASDKLDGFKQLINLRKDVRRTSPANFAGSVDEMSTRVGNMENLVSGIDARFVREQQSQIFVDLGNKALRLSEFDAAKKLNGRAMGALRADNSDPASQHRYEKRIRDQTKRIESRRGKNRR